MYDNSINNTPNELLLIFQSARFRDTSQQIHKQWQADPARAFPTVGHQAVVGSIPTATTVQTTATTKTTTTTKNIKEISSTVDAISCSPNSTPSPSPSSTDSQIVTVSFYTVIFIECERSYD